MDLSQKQTDALHDQIKHNFHLAWFNLLREKTLQNPPDFDWIVSLYRELRFRLTCFLKKDSSPRVKIEQDLDIELFDQMIRNGAFQGPEFIGLVNYIFKCFYNRFFTDLKALICIFHGYFDPRIKETTSIIERLCFN